MAQSSSAVIFVVDDDEDDCFLLEKLFSQYSPEHRLRFLADGSELLDALASTTPLPCLILLDLNMPLMNGLEALTIIRKQPAYAAIPVVILSTSANPSDQQQAAKLGANGYVTKPTRLEDLNQLVLKLRYRWLLQKSTT